MKRDIEWIDKDEDGGKRVVRVGFFGDGKIQWQFKNWGDEHWDTKSLPTKENWETLEDKVECRYNRQSSTLVELELVRALRKKHG